MGFALKKNEAQREMSLSGFRCEAARAAQGRFGADEIFLLSQDFSPAEPDFLRFRVIDQQLIEQRPGLAHVAFAQKAVHPFHLGVLANLQFLDLGREWIGSRRIFLQGGRLPRLPPSLLRVAQALQYLGPQRMVSLGNNLGRRTRFPGTPP